MCKSEDIVFVWFKTFPKDTSLHNCVKFAKFQDQYKFEAVCALLLWPKVKRQDWCWFELLSVMVIRLRTDDWCHPRRNIKNKPLKFLPTGKTLHLFVTSGFLLGFCSDCLQFCKYQSSSIFLHTTDYPGLSQWCDDKLKHGVYTIHWQLLGEENRGWECQTRKERKKALHHFSFSRMFMSTSPGFCFFFKFLKMSFESFN